MARPLLKRPEAIAWLPARSELAAGGLSPEDRFLFWPVGGRNPQISSLASLGKVKQISLVLDARDVLVTSAQIPPLPPKKLALALPNIVEDQLLQDPNTVSIALGDRTTEGQRRLAIADRAWLEQLRSSFERRGIRVNAIWPAQLSVPQRDGRWVIAATSQGLTVRSSACAFGWQAGATHAQRCASLHALLDTVALQERVSAKDMGIDAVIDDSQWSEVFKSVALERGIQFEVFSLPKPKAADTNLLDPIAGSLGKSGQDKNQKFNWRHWRLPIGLAVACAVAAIGGLNLMWWQLEREKSNLLEQTQRSFREAFPKATVVVNPKLQAQRLVSDLRRNLGAGAPDDLAALVKRLGDGLEGAAIDAVHSIDYADGRLKVKFQPGVADSGPARDQMKQSLQRAGLSIKFENEREPIATIGILS
jgi:general secretion pathway protein L